MISLLFEKSKSKVIVGIHSFSYANPYLTCVSSLDWIPTQVFEDVEI